MASERTPAVACLRNSTTESAAARGYGPIHIRASASRAISSCSGPARAPASGGGVHAGRGRRAAPHSDGGTGELSKLLSERGYRVEALNPSELQCAIAERKVPRTVPIHRCTFEEFVPAPGQQFDCAVFGESFQYVDIPAALAKLSKMAKYVVIMDFYKKSSNSLQGGGFDWKLFTEESCGPWIYPAGIHEYYRKRQANLYIQDQLLSRFSHSCVRDDTHKDPLKTGRFYRFYFWDTSGKISSASIGIVRKRGGVPIRTISGAGASTR